jgi:hypothetical protein
MCPKTYKRIWVACFKGVSMDDVGVKANSVTQPEIDLAPKRTFLK